MILSIASTNVLIDEEDLEKIQLYKWSAKTNRIGGDIYFVSASHFYENGIRKTRQIYLHRMIMGNPKGKCIDHINGDTLDNRKNNLRVCTRQENARNQRKINKKNTSGYRGVSWHKKAKKWAARITYNQKDIYIGLFDCPAKAHDAFRQKAIELFKDFSGYN